MTLGISLEPIDKVAAVVIRPASAIHKHPERVVPHIDKWNEQIAAILANPVKRKPPEAARNWTGVRQGRITVVGYSHCYKSQTNPKKKAKHFWVVRCDCGNYEMRIQISLGRKNKQADMCDRCREVCHLKWLATGTNKYD